MAPLPSTPPLTTESPPPPPPSSSSSSSSSSLKALSIPDRADRLLKALGFFAAQHPLAKPFLSLRSHFQTLIQVHFRIPRVPQQSFASTHSFAAILPGDSVAGLVAANGINNFLNIYNTLLVVRLVLTWFPNSPPAIVSPLSTICDPYLNIFRGIIPPLGGTLDLSPILAFLVLNAFSSTAAALPAELPSQQNVPSRARASLQDLTAAQEKWMKRLSSKSSKN